MAKTKTKQPAVKSYFFSKGYVDLKNTIVSAWKSNARSISRYKDNLSGLSGETWLKKLFFGTINILAMLSVIICGSVITTVISAIHIAILLLFMLLVYIGFTVIWCIDRIYLHKNKIFTACHVCKEKSLIPTYLCSGCGVQHTRLTPGVYGILHRTCECGTKLPTTFFNGRKNLSAICPYCGHPLMDRESRPICIPIIGGRSVGKTAFITAFSKEFIEKVAPSKSFHIEFYNSEKEQIFKEIESDYISGGTRMTKHASDTNSTSSVSFSFFVQHPSLKPERLVHVYDIAGEVFTNNDENEVQKQYEYCQGMILMFDPFSVPEIADKYESAMNAKDIAGIGRADITYIMDSFMDKLRQVTGLSEREMSRTPIAVVLGKTDTADLENCIGDTAVRELMRNQSVVYQDYYDTMDHICRQFLKDNGLENFVNQINNKFSDNRFFSCSAIGHTKDSGPYDPKGVLAPMEWLFQKADKDMAKIWNDDSFSKVPLSLIPAKK